MISRWLCYAVIPCFRVVHILSNMIGPKSCKSFVNIHPILINFIPPPCRRLCTQYQHCTCPYLMSIVAFLSENAFHITYLYIINKIIGNTHLKTFDLRWLMRYTICLALQQGDYLIDWKWFDQKTSKLDPHFMLKP